MTRFHDRLSVAHLFVAWALIFALPQAAHAVGMIRISDPSMCLDGMETDPDNDELDTILIAADEGCMLPQQDVISI